MNAERAGGRVAARALLAILVGLASCKGSGRGDAGPGAGKAGAPATAIEVTEVSGKSFVGSPAIESPVAGAILSDGGFVVADAGSYALRFFDASGKAVRTVGREGSGPGEFQSLPWLRKCSGDSLYVWDALAGRISVFEPHGAFAREFRLAGRPGLVECSSKGLLAVIMQPTEFRRPDPNGVAPRLNGRMLLTDVSGTELVNVGDVPAFENRPAGRRTRLAVGSRRVYLGTQDSAAVLVLDTAGHVAGSIPVGISGRAMTRSAYEHAIDLLAGQLVVADERNAYRESMLKIPMPAEQPPYFELFADSLGTLWAQVSSPGSGATTLSRTASDGSRLDDVTLPHEVKVLDVSPDLVLASFEDRGGIPHVVMYRVARR